MASAMKCDRCGRYYDADAVDGRVKIKNNDLYYLKMYNTDNIRIGDVDLCPACTNSFYDWLYVHNNTLETDAEVPENLSESYFGACPYFESGSSGIMCKLSSTCDKPCNEVDLYKMQEVKVNCPYRKDVICGTKNRDCKICDIYQYIFGKEDNE